MNVDTGYAAGRAPRGPTYRAALEEEIVRMESFLSARAT
jgi:hypothetical protein